MATVSELIDQVRETMSGNGGSSDQVSVLITPIDETALSFTAMVNSGQLGVADGVVEIGTEQIFLSSVNMATGECEVAPGIGRGYNGTVARAHAANSKIISGPRLPRSTVLRAMNNCLRDFFPDLFAVRISTMVTDGTTSAFDVDEDCVFVAGADVRLNDDSPWQALTAYKLTQPEVDGAPVQLQLPSALPPGLTVRIAQATRPVVFTTELDDSAIHNIPLDIDSLLVAATVAKLTPNSDLDRLEVSTPEQSARSRVVPASAAFTAARFLYGPYTQQMQSARRALRTRFPIRVVRTF